MTKDAFDKFDAFDLISLDAFDKVELPPEEKILFSAELKKLIKEELILGISKLPVGEIVSEVTAKALEKVADKREVMKVIEETKKDLSEIIEETKKEKEEIIEKLKDKYADLRNELLNHPRLELGGFAPPSTIGHSGEFLTNNGAGSFSWATAGLTIGGSISGGTPYAVLFADSSGNLGQNDNFTWSDTYYGTNSLLSGDAHSNSLTPSFVAANTSSFSADNYAGYSFRLNNGAGMQDYGYVSMRSTSSDTGKLYFGVMGGGITSPVFTISQSGSEFLSPLTVSANLNIGSSNSFFFGDGVTNGSWRIRISGEFLLTEKLVGGVWTESSRQMV